MVLVLDLQTKKCLIIAEKELKWSGELRRYGVQNKLILECFQETDKETNILQIGTKSIFHTVMAFFILGIVKNHLKQVMAEIFTLGAIIIL